MSKPNIDPEKLNELIEMASKKSGIDKKNLQSVADSGTLDKIFGSLSEKDAKRVQNIISDKKAAEKILSTPQARAILKKLTEDKK